MQQLMYQHFGTLSLHSSDVFAEDKKKHEIEISTSRFAGDAAETELIAKQSSCPTAVAHWDEFLNRLKL